MRIQPYWYGVSSPIISKTFFPLKCRSTSVLSTVTAGSIPGPYRSPVNLSSFRHGVSRSGRYSFRILFRRTYWYKPMCFFARFSSPRIFFNAKDLSPANSGNIWQRASYPLSCTVPGMLSVHSPLPVTNLKNDPFPHNAMGHKNQLIRTTWQIFAWFQA